MELYPFELEANIIQLIVLVVVAIYYAIKTSGKRELVSRLFMWGLLGLIVANVYWNSKLLIDGNGTYAFTACDASTLGTFLIWSSMILLGTGHKWNKKAGLSLVPVCFVLFGIWNVTWWNIWSSEYILVNLLTGITVIYLFYVTVYSICKKEAFNKKDFYIWILATILLIIFQPFVFFADGNINQFADWAGVVVWLFICLFFVYKGFLDKKNRTLWIMLSFMYSTLAQYLTDGIKYSFFMLIQTAVLVVLVFTFDECEFVEVDAK